jgi:ADP-ribose pyrophosphatase
MTENSPSSNQQPQEFQLQENTLLETKRFRVDRVVQTFSDGSAVTKEVIRHPGAVVILPLLADGRVCLIRNFRVAIGQWLLELPAGTLEPNEPPERTAERELIEETGYHCDRLEPLCTFFMSPGILREKMHAFVARDIRAGQAAREPGEMIDNFLVTPADIDRLIREQQIQDAKTIAAWLFFQRFAST